MSTVKQKILDAGSNLCLDEVITTTCPFCMQDWLSAGKPATWAPSKSLSVKRVTAGLVYICFRATCSSKPGLLASGPVRLRHSTKEFIPKRYTGDLETLSEEVWERYIRQYDIPYEYVLQQGWKFAPAEQRIYKLLYNYEGYPIGEEVKSVIKGVKPKTILYRHVDSPMLHYPLGQPREGPLILVEDIMSATKISLVSRAAALIGTNITKPMVHQLLRNGDNNVILMLDPDAVQKAVTLKRRWQHLFGNFSVKLLSKEEGDPKDLDLETIKKLPLEKTKKLESEYGKVTS